MYISYFDETGDEGYPKYSSNIFVLSSVYLHHQKWKKNNNKLFELRKFLKNEFTIPVKLELHTKHILLNKNPYRLFKWDETKRLELLKTIASELSKLDLHIINVCINKTKINSENESRYKNILDVALCYNIQRIENDLRKRDPSTKFMIVTDEGRVGKMRNIARKIQKFNFIPSKYNATTYRDEIKLLIEDPLPKNSSQSYFIQISDFVSYFVYLYILRTQKLGSWHNRLNWLKLKKVEEIMTILKPILNTEASKDDPFGIVVYPK